jgi:hypothetical protein
VHRRATTTLTGPVATCAAGCDASAARIQRWLPFITGSKHRSRLAAHQISVDPTLPQVHSRRRRGMTVRWPDSPRIHR